MTTKISSLLVGIDQGSLPALVDHLTKRGHAVMTAESFHEAAPLVTQDQELNLVFLQGSAGTLISDAIRPFRDARPELPLVIVSPDCHMDATLEAWRSGAADITFLPLKEDSVDAVVRRVLKRESKESREVQARFRFVDESGKERWIPIVPPKFTLGRSSNNDLVFKHLSVSRMHAEVSVDGDTYMLRDLDSKQGTFVNGVRITESELTHGDRVQIGIGHNQALTFHKGDLLQSLLGKKETKTDANIAIAGFKEMGMLLSAFRALSSIPLLDDLLSLVVDTAVELTAAERGFIMLADPDGSLDFRCARNNLRRPLDGSSFKTSRKVPEEVFRNGKSVVIRDLDIDENLEAHAPTRQIGVRSICCVPLRYMTLREAGGTSGIGRTETIGVLYVDSHLAGAGLSTTQMEALETLASEAAMAIYNARLYKESQEKRKLEEELKIAAEIQQALLPETTRLLPHVRSFSFNLPCHEVGGDYFDYFEMDADRFGFALGDVAGKGMPAALLTMMLQGIFSSQALLDLPVPAMLANINLSLVRRGTSNRFVTFFFGVLDAAGRLTYSNAGHNPPILLSRDGSMRDLTEGGMVLGLFGFAQYTSETVELKPGDHLVLFTDGAVEARSVTGEEFGEDRLRHFLQDNAGLASEDLLEGLRQAILSHSANAPQHDDITMMILGFKEAESGTIPATQIMQTSAKG